MANKTKRQKLEDELTKLGVEFELTATDAELADLLGAKLKGPTSTETVPPPEGTGQVPDVDAGDSDDVPSAPAETTKPDEKSEVADVPVLVFTDPKTKSFKVYKNKKGHYVVNFAGQRITPEGLSAEQAHKLAVGHARAR